MSERNKKGENCDCGSTAEHQRGPGCTLSTRGGGAVEVGPAYIVGTCLACGKQYDSRAGHECTPRPTPEERLAALESAVERIGARMPGGRPTPPGVFPPVSGYVAVSCMACGWRGEGETRLVAHIRDEHGRDVASIRDTGLIVPPAPEVDAQIYGPLVPSEGQCAYPIGGGVVCRLPPGHDGAHGVSWPASYHPAVGVATVDGKATCPKCPESVESRATYARVPEHAAPTPAVAAIREWSKSPPLPHVGAGCWCRMGSACPWLESQAPTPTDAGQKVCACSELASDERPCPTCWARDASAPTPAEAAIFERGGYVSTMPPIAGLVTDKNKALMKTWGAGQVVAPSPMHCCGSSSSLHGVGCPMAQTLADMDAGLRPTPTHEGPCDHGVPCLTPATMLGEAVALAERIAVLCGQVVVAEANSGHSLTDVYAHAADVGGLARQMARSLRAAQREAEAREGGR